MIAEEIHYFIERLNQDPENKDVRRRFHENYEWLESYWKVKFNSNNGDQLFCNYHGEFYWSIDEVKSLARNFCQIRPVGSSNNNFQTTTHISRATYFLKYKSELFNNGEEHDATEEGISYADNWNSTSFHAIFSIIKQIRDNLFHGRKIDLDEEQYERNKILVGMGADFTDILLLNLREAESNL